jgi:hypothetical protein
VLEEMVNDLRHWNPAGWGEVIESLSVGATNFLILCEDKAGGILAAILAL